MLLTFSLEISDYIAFSKEYLKKTFIFKPYIFGIAIIVAAILTLTNDNQLFIRGNKEPNQTVIDLVSFVFTLGFLVGIIWIVRSSVSNRYYKYYRGNNHLAGERSIQFNTASLDIKKDTKKSQIRRGEIKNVGETLHFIYLAYDKRKVLLLPKKAGIDYQTVMDWINDK